MNAIAAATREGGDGVAGSVRKHRRAASEETHRPNSDLLQPYWYEI